MRHQARGKEAMPNKWAMVWKKTMILCRRVFFCHNALSFFPVRLEFNGNCSIVKFVAIDSCFHVHIARIHSAAGVCDDVMMFDKCGRSLFVHYLHVWRIFFYSLSSLLDDV